MTQSNGIATIGKADNWRKGVYTTDKYSLTSNDNFTISVTIQGSSDVGPSNDKWISVCPWYINAENYLLITAKFNTDGNMCEVHPLAYYNNHHEYYAEVDYGAETYSEWHGKSIDLSWGWKNYNRYNFVITRRREPDYIRDYYDVKIYNQDDKNHVFSCVFGSSDLFKKTDAFRVGIHCTSISAQFGAFNLTKGTYFKWRHGKMYSVTSSFDVVNGVNNSISSKPMIGENFFSNFILTSDCNSNIKYNSSFSITADFSCSQSSINQGQMLLGFVPMFTNGGNNYCSVALKWEQNGTGIKSIVITGRIGDESTYINAGNSPSSMTTGDFHEYLWDTNSIMPSNITNIRVDKIRENNVDKLTILVKAGENLSSKTVYTDSFVSKGSEDIEYGFTMYNNEQTVLLSGVAINIMNKVTVSSANGTVDASGNLGWNSVKGVGTTAQSFYIDYNETVTINNLTPIAHYKTGSLTENGTTKQFTSGSYTSGQLTSATTYVVTFVPETYNIYYYDKNGSSQIHPTGAPTTHTYNSETTLVDASRTGFDFAGWYKNSDCSGNRITKIGATEITSDINLYAKWLYKSFISKGNSIYFQPSNKWYFDPPSLSGFKMEFYGISGDVIGSDYASKTDDDLNIYTIPERHTYEFSWTEDVYAIKIYAMSDSTTTISEWSSGIIAMHEGVADSFPCLKMDINSSWQQGWTTSSDSGAVCSWGTLTCTVFSTDQTHSSSTNRVFVNKKGCSWEDNGCVAVRAWGGTSSSFPKHSYNGVEATIYFMNWFEDSGTWYGYCELPTDITGFQFIHTDKENDKSAVILHYINWVSDETAAASDHKSIKQHDYMFSKIYYCNGSEDSNIWVTTGGAKDDKCGQALLSNVFEGYCTCLNNKYNGFRCSPTLNSNFYSKATDADRNAAKVEDGKFTVKQKYTYMDMLNSTIPQSNLASVITFGIEENENISNITLLIIVISSSSLLLLSGLSVALLIKRKRINN